MSARVIKNHDPLLAALIEGFAEEIRRPLAPGFWMGVLTDGGPEIPAAVVLHQTEPGNPLNRLEAPYRQPYINGEPVGDHAMTRLRHLRVIDEKEYRYRVRDAAWLRVNAPDDPKASPQKRVDFGKIKFNF